MAKREERKWRRKWIRARAREKRVMGESASKCMGSTRGSEEVREGKSGEGREREGEWDAMIWRSENMGGKERECGWEGGKWDAVMWKGGKKSEMRESGREADEGKWEGWRSERLGRGSGTYKPTNPRDQFLPR